LHGSTHPVSWLRIQMLAQRARQRGDEKTAAQVLQQWEQVGQLLSVSEDYHGFYTDSLQQTLVRVLDDMLVEASPRECSSDECRGDGWESVPNNIPSLMNRVWMEYTTPGSNYGDWEARVLKEQYSLGDS